MGSYRTPKIGLSPGYKNTAVDEGLQRYPELDGSQPGDPDKAARAIIDVATGTGDGASEQVRRCLRLPLGNDAMNKARAFVKQLSDDLDAVESIARSTTFSN